MLNTKTKSSINSGTYIAISYKKESLQHLYKFMEELGLVNVQGFELHSTIIYTKRNLKEVKALGDIEWEVKVIGYSIWYNPGQYPVFVLRCKCPQAIKRNKKISDKYKISGDFEEFRFHITLDDSYTKDVKHTKEHINKLINNIPTLIAIKEYKEELLNYY